MTGRGTKEPVEKDDEGRPYQCGAFVSGDSRWHCVRESDHEGDHDWRLISRPSEEVEALAELRSALERGEASDGYHTHRELYEYRMLYNAHAAVGWLACGIRVVKSRRHSDGEPCFGGGWFIVVAELPTGQVSNHYRDEHWDLFDVPEVALPPEYDGHTPQDAADRLLASLRGEGGES